MLLLNTTLILQVISFFFVFFIKVVNVCLINIVKVTLIQTKLVKFVWCYYFINTTK